MVNTTEATCMGEYKLGGMLSETSAGCEGQVLSGIRQSDNVEVAVKVVSKEMFNENQLAVMRLMDSQNIVKLFDSFDDNSSVYLVMELARGGDLFEHLIQNSKISEEETMNIVRQLVSAVHHMHKQGVAHGDIKPENILFSSSNRDCIKLADFGSAKFLHQQNHQSVISTAIYAAPELLFGGVLDTAADMWSVGAVVYTLLAGFPPFGSNPRTARKFIRQASYSFPNDAFEGVSNAARDFIVSLLALDPSQRLSAEAALRHPWLAQVAVDN